MKKNHMLFTILFAIYIAAGVIAIILFYTKGSYLSRELAASATVRIETDTLEPDTVEPETPAAPETPAEPQTPEVPEEPAEPEAPKEPTKPEPEAPEEPTKPADDSDSDSDSDSTNESASADASDVTEDPAADATDSEDDGKTYYGFTVIDGVTGVRIRETSDRNSKTVSHIDGGKSGYVLEKGDTRSKILTKKGTIGYIYNEYLTITEIPKTDFPEEYR